MGQIAEVIDNCQQTVKVNIVDTTKDVAKITIACRSNWQLPTGNQRMTSLVPGE